MTSCEYCHKIDTDNTNYLGDCKNKTVTVYHFCNNCFSDILDSTDRYEDYFDSIGAALNFAKNATSKRRLD